MKEWKFVKLIWFQDDKTKGDIASCYPVGKHELSGDS